jgi:hypothetical protein
MRLKNLAVNPEFALTLNALRTILETERLIHNDGNTPYKYTDKLGKDFWAMYKSVKESKIP